MQTLRASRAALSIRFSAAKPAVAKPAPKRANTSNPFVKAAQTAGVAFTSLALSAAAHATTHTVLLGSNDDVPVYVPRQVAGCTQAQA